MAVDRSRAAMLDVNVSGVGQMVQLVTNGMIIGEFRPDDADEEVEISCDFQRPIASWNH